MKNILILTGPQGSGNRMWSKIFAVNPDVYGWQALNKEYWIGHDQEPFAECWANPEKLDKFDWRQSDYYVTSTSIPYMNNGEPTIPDVYYFGIKLQAMGFNVRIGIIGRDRNVIGMQEQRVRGEPTFEKALKEIRRLDGFPTVFLSYELLHLYHEQYLKQLSQQLSFPIAWADPRVKEIIKDDTNAKYFSPVEHHPTDDLARKTSKKWHD